MSSYLPFGQVEDYVTYLISLGIIFQRIVFPICPILIYHHQFAAVLPIALSLLRARQGIVGLLLLLLSPERGVEIVLVLDSAPRLPGVSLW